MRGVRQTVAHVAEQAIKFASFTLDRRSGRLTRGDETIALRAKTWAVLCYLAERPGVLVTKDELFADIWADTAVTDDTLAKSIGELRVALGDDPRNPRFIETVHRRGFRFIAKTKGAALNGSAAGEEDVWQPAAAHHLVGRDAELQRLRGCFRNACAGQRQVVFVTGEPGIGKTALIEAFVAGLPVADACDRPSPGVRVAYGCSIEQRGEREAYLPVLAALENLVREQPGSDVLALLQRFAPSWLAQMPWLLDADAAKALETSLAGVRPERMQREFCAFVETLAAEGPFCLVLEDLHWSDPATAELLVMLAQRRERARVLVLATCRTAETAEHAALSEAKRMLRQRNRCVEIVLHPLSLAAVEVYVETRFPGCSRSHELARLVHEHTDGTPLFIGAVLDDLRARGWLVETDPGWALTVPGAKVELRVPENLREMIDAQLAAMRPQDRAVLEAASVAGLEFTPHDVAAALGADVDDVDGDCRRLSGLHRFVRSVGAAEHPRAGSVARYGFVHALHRQVVYESTPQGRRRRLHQRLGERIEADHAGRTAEVAAHLAMHFESSRDLPRALKYLTDAGTRVQWFAARESVAYLEHALELTGRLPDAGIRNRHELDVRSALSSALGSFHGYASDTARGNYERVCKLCEEVGTPADLYVALYALWPSQAARAEHGCVETAERLVQLARDGGNAEWRVQADVVLGRTLWWQGKFREACDVLEPVVGFWERNGTSSRGSVFELEPPEIAAPAYLGAASGLLGNVERTRECIRVAISLGERIAQPFVLAGTFLHAAYLSHLLRDSEETEKLARRTIALAEEHEFPFWNGLAVALLGWAHVERGEPERGAELIREGLALQHATGTRVVSSHMLAFLAAAHLRGGEVAAGLDAIEEGLQLVASSCDKIYEPELWRLKGELLTAAASKKRKGKRASADTTNTEGDDCFYRALEIARANDAKSLELRAAVSLARLRAAQARPAEGRTVLAPVCEWFADGVDTPDLREARALLVELRSRA